MNNEKLGGNNETFNNGETGWELVTELANKMPEADGDNSPTPPNIPSEKARSLIENLEYDDCRKRADDMLKHSIENLQNYSEPSSDDEYKKYSEDYDFRKKCYRKEYDEHPEQYLKYRFYENAKSILNQSSSTFQHITMEIGKPYELENVSVTELMDYNEDHYRDYEWRKNFVTETEDIDSIGAVACDFVDMTKELFGKKSKIYGEVCRSMSELSHDTLGRKLKVKEMEDAQFMTFGGMLDKDDGPAEMISTNIKTVPVLYGRENGNFYKRMHNVNNNPVTPNDPIPQNVIEQAPKNTQDEKTPEELGFRDW